MNVIAKMVCESVVEDGAPDNKYAEQVTLNAVYGDSEENKSYADATPNASVQMTINNKAAWGSFSPGKDYYVKFEEAP